MKKRILLMIISCALIFSSVIPMTVLARNNHKISSEELSSGKDAVENEEGMDNEGTEEDEETEGNKSANYNKEADKNPRTKDDVKEVEKTAVDKEGKDNSKRPSVFSSIELTEKERHNEKSEKEPDALRTEVSFFGLRSPRRFVVSRKEEKDSKVQLQNVTASNTVVYEDVTATAYDNEVEYDYGPKPNTETEYVAPIAECSGSPNGHHSWTDIYEWYNGEQLINSGASPAGGFTNSVYLFSLCDYCGARKQ